MNILINISHPAHVHVFKNFICKMKERGHNISIIAIDKDVAIDLLKIYGFDYSCIGSRKTSMIKSLLDIPLMDIKIYKIIKNFKPDIFVGFGSVYPTQIIKLFNKPSIIFDDDEYSYRYYYLFASTICGFSGFKIKGDKIIKINSYKELAYLHPNYFKPNDSIFESLGISKGDDFVLLRFVAWKAYHDISRHGFDLEAKRKLVKELSNHASVFISSESSLPKEFEKHAIAVSPERIHDLLYYAKMLVCDSQTMTTEAGVLGTPAIRCNSFVGNNDMLNFIELERKYGLIFNYSDPESAIEKAVELIKNANLKNIWMEKRDNLLKDKIDATSLMISLVENYPDSLLALAPSLIPKMTD